MLSDQQYPKVFNQTNLFDYTELDSKKIYDSMNVTTDNPSCRPGIPAMKTKFPLNLNISIPTGKYNKSKWKEYQFKFTKRENIDKKIMRKFRKYLRMEYKNNNEDIINWIISTHANAANVFWSKFIKHNLLPPFTYKPESKEFKSFSTSYMFWIFGHANSIELYKWYIQNNLPSLINHFTRLYHLTKREDEWSLLKAYITRWPIIFTNLSNAESTLIASKNNDYMFKCFPIPKSSSSSSNNNNITLDTDSNPAFYNNIECCEEQEEEDGSKPFDIFQKLINSDAFNSVNKSIGYHSKSTEIEEISSISHLLITYDRGEGEWNGYDDNEHKYYSASN